MGQDNRQMRKHAHEQPAFQNYHNVALAEQGLLADQLFMQPCIDIQTIYVPGNKTPYLSALLSDIYFSMGHIAFSQRYAFEANEGMGNFSPRMLQRLVQTSLIYGHYGTARSILIYLKVHSSIKTGPQPTDVFYGTTRL